MALRVQRVCVGILAILLGFNVLGSWTASVDRNLRRQLPLDLPGWMLIIIGLCFIVGGAAHAWRGVRDED